MSDESLRVILIEDHGMVRAGVRLVLERTPDIAVVGEAADGESGLRLFRRLAAERRVDVVVTNVGLPDIDGCEVTRRIKAHRPTVPVVALTMHADEPHVQGMLDAGADAYVLKEASARELPEAIRAVARGETALSPRAASVLLARLRRGPARQTDRLSARQREILRLLAGGMTSKEIAHRLGLSAKTVENHRAQVLNTLDAANTPAAVHLAYQEGLFAGAEHA